MRILIISSMYPGSLENFRQGRNMLKDLSYEEHNRLLLEESTEFVSSYTKSFRKKGIDAIAIIANDVPLQKKWLDHYNRNASLRNLIRHQVDFYKPDVLWIEDLRFISADTLKSISDEGLIKLLVLYHCAPVTGSLSGKLKYFDHVITCTPGLVKLFEESGLSSSLVYHGFDEDFSAIFQYNKPGHSNNVVFSGSLRQGSGYHTERINLLDYLLNSGIDITLYAEGEKPISLAAKRLVRAAYMIMRYNGFRHPEKLFGFLEYGVEPVTSMPKRIKAEMQQPVFGQKMYKVLNSSKIVLNNHGSVAGDYAGNMRMFEATGAGSCLLTDKKSNIKDLFVPDEEIVVYENQEDCANKIKWLLEHEDERRKIAEAGQRKTLKSHTVSLRCDNIIDILHRELSR